MRTTSWLILAVVCLASPASAEDPRPNKVDISAHVRDLVLLHDGSGHYIAAFPFSDFYENIFYSTDGKSFYRQHHQGGGSDSSEPKWSQSFWSEHPTHALLELQGKKWTTYCADRKTPLQVVSAADAKKVLKKATFFAPLFVRTSYFLARDDTGRYYYVDRREKSAGGKGFRLWVGKKGAMKRQQMTNIVSDSGGDIFATKNGDLRLIIDTEVEGGRRRTRRLSYWVKDGKKIDLKTLPARANKALIYGELGVYNHLFGTPCDDM